MINPKKKDIGKVVIYKPKNEFGVITSFNDSLVFVRYGSAIHSQGTNRRDLHWG